MAALFDDAGRPIKIKRYAKGKTAKGPKSQATKRAKASPVVPGTKVLKAIAANDPDPARRVWAEGELSKSSKSQKPSTPAGFVGKAVGDGSRCDRVGVEAYVRNLALSDASARAYAIREGLM